MKIKVFDGIFLFGSRNANVLSGYRSGYHGRMIIRIHVRIHWEYNSGLRMRKMILQDQGTQDTTGYNS